jgi:hypothetical protein
MGEAEEFLNYVTHYVTTSGKRIGPGETMAYGYWLVKFERADDNTLETWEYKADASDFVKGANLTMYWKGHQSKASATPRRITCRAGGSRRTSTTET